MAKNPESLKNLRPGNKRGPAKTTSLLKDAILKAADTAHPGGMVGYLRHQAMENPGTFLSLLGKVLPLQVTGQDGGPIKAEVTVSDDLRQALDAIAGKISGGAGEG